MLGCDPTVTDALLLHMVDDPDLGRFQTGLLRLDFSERPSYAAVRKAVAAARNCKTLTSWTAGTGVVGAKAIFHARDHPPRKAIFGISARAAEEARAKAGMFRVRGPGAKPATDEIARSLSRATRDTDAVMTTRKHVRAGHKPRLEFRGQVAPGALRLRPPPDGDDEPRSAREPSSARSSASASLPGLDTNACSLLHGEHMFAKTLLIAFAPGAGRRPSRRGRPTARGRSSDTS